MAAFKLGVILASTIISFHILVAAKIGIIVSVFSTWLDSCLAELGHPWRTAASDWIVDKFQKLD